MSTNITFKRLTVYKKIPESSWTKITNYIQGNNNSSDCRFLNQSAVVRRQWNNTFKNWKKKASTQNSILTGNIHQKMKNRDL